MTSPLSFTSMITLLDTAVASKNGGDQIIMDAVRQQLAAMFPGAYFVNVATHDTLGKDGYKLIEDSAYAFVGGTNLLSSNMDTYNQWRIGWRDVFKLRPVILMGVGWWQYQPPPNRFTRFLLGRVLRQDVAHSVRDGYTHGQLGGVRLTGGTVNTGCPTLWGLTPEHTARIPAEKGEDVVMTLTDYKPDKEKDKHLYHILKKRYRKVYLWLQGARDYAYATEILGRHIEFLEPRLAAYDQLLASSASLDYVGTRLHAGIRALQHQRRTMIVAVDNRAKEMGRDFGLPVIERPHSPRLKETLELPAPTRLTIPFDAIAAWKAQFRQPAPAAP